MIQKIQDSRVIEEAKTYELASGVHIHCLTAQRNDREGRTALYIHGGGSGGNHTIVKRPSLWMLQRGLFDRVIMPDRRGAGKSSPITKVMTYADNARDMKELLDSMGIHDKITAIGVSYGGPIALTLAAMDDRIEQVILVASSPSLKPAKGIMGYLYSHHMLEPIVGFVYKKIVGKLPEADGDFDAIYDAKNVGDLKKIFLKGIQSTPKNRLESLLLENASTCNLDNQGISADINLNIPVLRVIGTKDETWEVSLGETYTKRIPDIRTAYIEGAGHKDVFFRAEAFYTALENLMSKR